MSSTHPSDPGIVWVSAQHLVPGHGIVLTCKALRIANDLLHPEVLQTE